LSELRLPNWNWVDRIAEIDEQKKSLIGERFFSAEEWYFEHHFPGQPIVPGVFLIEAMAHCLGVLGGLIVRRSTGVWRTFVLLTVDQAKFYRFAKPDSIIRFHANIVDVQDDILFGRVKAYHEDNIIAKSSIKLISNYSDVDVHTQKQLKNNFIDYLERVLDERDFVQYV